MLSCFDFIRESTTLAMALRLLLAFICGAVIGAEREIKRRPAGQGSYHRRRTVGLGHRRPCLRRRLRRVRDLRDRGHTLCRDSAHKVRV